MDRCVLLRIRGRVQGVSFRYSSWLKARQLQLAGYVRNEPDGSVSVMAEGRPGDVEKFIAWARRGPAFSRVGSVDVEEMPLQHLSGFQILS